MTDKTEQQREHFNRIAATYREARRDANHLLLKELIWAEAFRDDPVPSRPGLKVLEAMCGFGEGRQILESQLRVPVDYVGFDYSDDVVAALQRDRPDLKIVQADATRFATDERYDVVILIGGLHHVPDAASEVVRRLAAALEPGGSFISLEPTHGNTLFRMVRESIYRRNALFDRETERAFAVEDLAGMFEAAGLTCVRMLWPGLLSYVLYYNPDAFPWLNVGGARTVRLAFALDRPFMRSPIGRALSFATLSLWRKP